MINTWRLANPNQDHGHLPHNFQSSLEYFIHCQSETHVMTLTYFHAMSLKCKKLDWACANNNNNNNNSWRMLLSYMLCAQNRPPSLKHLGNVVVIDMLGYHIQYKKVPFDTKAPIKSACHIHWSELHDLSCSIKCRTISFVVVIQWLQTNQCGPIVICVDQILSYS